MELNIFEANNQTIAEVLAAGVVMNNVQDALDTMASANYYGAGSIIIQEKHLHRDFFNLRTGLAGDILQKYANYGMKLAVIGQFEKFKSNSLTAFMVECNRGNLVFFVANREAAVAKITRVQQNRGFDTRN